MVLTGTNIWIKVNDEIITISRGRSLFVGVVTAMLEGSLLV